MMGKYLDEFDKALQVLVNDERMKVYGHPADHFPKSSIIKSVLTCADPAAKHALDMIADKMVRLDHSPDHLDSWIDIAGYARAMVMVLDSRENPRPFKDTMPKYPGPQSDPYKNSQGKLLSKFGDKDER